MSGWQQFLKQRANAKRRGIGFYLTYNQWLAIWEESGFYHLRGRGGFVMRRIDNDGAYEVGNVEIVNAHAVSAERRQQPARRR